jgi:hypothetical protein
MNTVTPKKESIKKKRGEIQRLLELMEFLGLDYAGLSEETEVSIRTIQNCVWNDSEIGAQLLRALHLKLGVSMDWVVSGSGSMFYRNDEPTADYAEDSRAVRMIRFIKTWMRESDNDEKAWLETQFKFAVPQYQQFLLKGHIVNEQ